MRLEQKNSSTKSEPKETTSVVILKTPIAAYSDFSVSSTKNAFGEVIIKEPLGEIEVPTETHFILQDDTIERVEYKKKFWFRAKFEVGNNRSLKGWFFWREGEKSLAEFERIFETLAIIENCC